MSFGNEGERRLKEGDQKATENNDNATLTITRSRGFFYTFPIIAVFLRFSKGDKMTFFEK